MQTIVFGDEGLAATRELLARLESLRERWEGAIGEAARRFEPMRERLAVLERIDRQYGGNAPLALEAVEDVPAWLLTELALVHSEAGRRSIELAEEIADLAIGIALWTIRHDVPLGVVEPVANALALRSNQAASRESLAAAFGLMQGVIRHVAPHLEADLERSNPERPWRILHLNLAITAIRSEDATLMRFAFDALDAALPDERAGFYAEALALALSPRIAPEVRASIEERHRKWTLAA